MTVSIASLLGVLLGLCLYAGAQTVLTLAGQVLNGFADGVGSAAYFNWPESGIALGNNGTVMITDTQSGYVRVIYPNQTVTTLMGLYLARPKSLAFNTSTSILYVGRR